MIYTYLFHLICEGLETPELLHQLLIGDGASKLHSLEDHHGQLDIGRDISCDSAGYVPLHSLDPAYLMDQP